MESGGADSECKKRAKHLRHKSGFGSRITARRAPFKRSDKHRE
jgi:hypothetical protein